MKLVIISPEQNSSDEIEIVGALFASGLDRFHVRKPHAASVELETYVQGIPVKWRSRIVLHQHHELVERYGLGGRHWRDETGCGLRPSRSNDPLGRDVAADGFMSRSCHDLPALGASLGLYDSVFFGPVFESVSKPGYGPKGSHAGEAVGVILHARTAAQRRTAVLAIGGITVETAPRVLPLGFDGVAVLGAIWQASDPVTVFRELQRVCKASVSQAPVLVGGKDGRPVRSVDDRSDWANAGSAGRLQDTRPATGGLPGR